ncbi:DNA-directed DNA polymerase [Candidatus Endolissoclinum faulkneri L5]|uniref:DNA polymerase I n=1 Tax=Candidatus Endolissoclinum faulkneri L5 TaxID=1401328 RepID=V9TSW6_9PROT|nr:DNA polymerase I [Candidatus Endolissoclinum faulkneri]AHC74019.1 DNA-directed DNA polymerase [Candidatus Endolissoclinum faulkneri L5]
MKKFTISINNATDSDHNRLFLVDGSGYVFRAYYALPPMNRADGMPVNAVFGFCNMLIKLMEDRDINRTAVILDNCRFSFRNKIYHDYKANRPELPENLIKQFSLIRKATMAFNVPCIEMEGFEADDVIATYTREAVEKGWQVTILSSDKDMMQLIRPGVIIYDPMKKVRISTDQVKQKFGVFPERVVDVQALAGDCADNVPGVPSIGIKTAAQLIKQYGDLETLLGSLAYIKQPKRRQKLIQNAHLARISKQLVTLKDDIQLSEDLEDLIAHNVNVDNVISFLYDQNFKKLISRFESNFVQNSYKKVDHKNILVSSISNDVKYEIITNMEDLRLWINAAETNGIVSINIETTSLNAMRAELLGISLALAPGKACYIPLRHMNTRIYDQLKDTASFLVEEVKQVPFNEAILVLKKLFENSSVLKIVHNGKYDCLVLSRKINGEITVNPLDDVMCISYVLDGSMHGHGLDELSFLHFKHAKISFADVCGKGKKQISFAEVNLDKAAVYAAENAAMIWRLHKVLHPRLVTEHMSTVYEVLERPLIPILVDMERNGITVDPQILGDMSKDFAKRIVQRENEIYYLAGEKFNLSSHKQLGKILFDKLRLPCGKKSKAGSYSTGAKVLEIMVDKGVELADKILEYRRLTKLKSTYVDVLLTKINPETKRIHTSYSMTGVATGRLSSNHPNLQNIPVRTDDGRKIRTAFIAGPGNVLLSVDYSQIELRILADVAGLEGMRMAFNCGIDIHEQTASEVFGISLDRMTSDVRRKAKAINFGIIYGISSFGLARQLGISRIEAQGYINAYFKRFSGIIDYMLEMKRRAYEYGYVQTLFGRKIYIDAIHEKNLIKRNFGERAAINAPIQGTAADIIKRAMVRLSIALHKTNFKAKMLLQVHDELLFEVPERNVETTAALVKEVMEGAATPSLNISVPLVVKAGWGNSHGAAH